MKYYAVIDTNVLVSAMLKWNSVPGKVMELVFSGVIVPVFCEEILAEYDSVLHRPKFHLTNEIIHPVIHEIKRLGIWVEPETAEIEMPDSKDRVFYEVTMRERKDEKAYLVTGNVKHFPNVDFVVTPREMIDLIGQSTE